MLVWELGVYWRVILRYYLYSRKLQCCGVVRCEEAGVRDLQRPVKMTAAYAAGCKVSMESSSWKNREAPAF